MILAPAAPAVNTAPTFMVARTAREEFHAGFDAYVDRRPYEAMTTLHERRGWMAANSAEAECGVPGYADRMGW